MGLSRGRSARPRRLPLTIFFGALLGLIATVLPSCSKTDPDATSGSADRDVQLTLSHIADLPGSGLALDLARNENNSVAIGLQEGADSESDSTPLIWTSENGTDWSTASPIGIGSTVDGECGVPGRVLTTVTNWNNRFLAFAYGGVDSCDSSIPLIYSSADGLEWIEDSTTGLAESDADGSEIYGVATDDDQIVAVGQQFHDDSQEDAAAWVSPDGRAWVSVQLPGGDTPRSEGAYGIVRTDDGYIAIGSADDEAGRETLVWRSGDGSEWEQVDASGFERGATFVSSPRVLSSADGVLVALGTVSDSDSATATAWISDDGSSWTRRDLGSEGSEDILPMGVLAEEHATLVVGLVDGTRPTLWSLEVR